MWSTLLVISVIVCASEGFEYYINIVGCVNKTVDLKCDGGMQYLMINNGMLWGVADLMNGNTCLKSRVNCTEHQMSNGLIVKAQSLCNNERRCQFTVPSKMLDECGAESNFINMRAQCLDGDTVSPTTLATSSTDSTTTETPDTNATQDTTTVVETTTNVIIVGTPDMGIKAETAVQLNSGSLEWWIYVVIALGIVMVLVISGLGVALIYYRRKVHRYFATKALRKHREITHPPAYRPESAFDNIITDHEVSFNESMPGVEEIAAPQNDCPDEVSTGYLISLGSSTTDSDSPNSTLSAAPSQVVLQEIRTEL